MIKYAVALLTLLCAAPAFAGEVSITNNQAVWKSTQCAAPAIPPLLSGVGSEDAASDVNSRVVQYNVYITQVQAYMNCMSGEAQADANQASAMIISAAQEQITGAKLRADALGASLKK